MATHAKNHGSLTLHCRNLGPCDIPAPESIAGSPVGEHTRIAAIAPLIGDDVGFRWGTDREHYVFDPRQPAAIAADLLAYYHASHHILNGADEDDAERWALGATARILRGEAPRGWDIAVVDISRGVALGWPSAGDSDCWEDDVWLGIADYLSGQRFGDLIGVPIEYGFPDPTTLCAGDLEYCDGFLPRGWRDQS